MITALSRSLIHLQTSVLCVSLRLQDRLRQRRAQGARGQGMVEYALILAFIAILVIVALKFLQPSIARTLNNVTNSL